MQNSDARLIDLLAKGGNTVLAQAAAMTSASARYNLGASRTINMPTVPLELLHPKHRRRFRYRLDGRDSVRGMETMRLAFDERDSPSIIKRADDKGDVTSKGSVWVETGNGRIWRVDVRFEDHASTHKSAWAQGRMRVEFVHDARLDVLVQSEMTEIFDVVGGRGEGKATYSNFKRFETSGRLVP